MRVYALHTDSNFLVRQNLPVQRRELPTLNIGVRFCLRNGALDSLQSVYALVDTGATLTALPAFMAGIYGTQVPRNYVDPEVKSLQGMHARRLVPVYRAVVSINDQILHGQYCRRCGAERPSERCHNCNFPNAYGVFKIAAVPTLRYPIIGRDVLNQFLTIIDPWRRTTAIAGGGSGKTMAAALRLLRGHRLT